MEPVTDPHSILAALRRLGEGPAEEKTNLGELVTRLDRRAHALVLLLLSAPNLTPGPSMPGFSTVFGLPLCVIAAEMVIGRRHLRLPRFLAGIEINRGRVAGLVRRLEPLLLRLEYVLRPRGEALAGAERPLAIVCLLLGILLSLPIPVFSMLPAAAIMALALGMLAHDGWAVATGLALGGATLVAFGGVIAAIVALLLPG